MKGDDDAPTRALVAGAGLCLLYLFWPPSLEAQPAVEELRPFLVKYAHFSRADFANLDRGRAVAKALDSTHPAELAVVGVVRLNVPSMFFLERFRDIAAFKKSEEVLQIGKFQMPPRPVDIEALTLDSDDLDALRKCKPGNCGLRLPATMIERFRTEVSWSSPDYAKRANELFRQMLVEYVNEYVEKGDDVLVDYHDKKDPVRLADGFRSLLGASPYLSEYAPELFHYLTEFPREKPQGVEEFIYWSKEKLSHRPVVTITHVTIYKVTRGNTNSIVIASKQIYANHYFEGSLGLSVFVEAQGALAPGAYLMYLNRSRVDLLHGIFSGLRRLLVKGRLLDKFPKYLEGIRDRVKVEYQTPKFGVLDWTNLTNAQFPILNSHPRGKTAPRVRATEGRGASAGSQANVLA